MIVTGPSEPWALISAVTVPPAGARLITTESVAVSVPFVQFKVNVVGEPRLGYQGWPEEIGPPLPMVEIPESPDGEVSVQAVALEDAQEYEYSAPSVIVIDPSAPLALISAVTVAGAGGGRSTTEISTESVAEVTPSVQFKVKTVGVPTVGYHG